MRVLTLNFGGPECASTHYRILQFIAPLRAAGIEVQAVPAGDFDDWASIRRYNVVLVQKKLLATGRVRFLQRHARALVYDTDDATWHPHGRPHHWLTRWRTALRLRRIVRAARVCRVANGVLAEAIRRFGGEVLVHPMALDEKVWPAPRDSRDGIEVRVGWSGAPSNLHYLEAIEPALAQVQRELPGLRLVVFCGKAPAFKHGLRFTHIPFEPGAEPGVVRGFDIGLLPLEENPFAAAKSPIKALQYLASGIPSIASPLQATRELFGDAGAAVYATDIGGWVEALRSLVKDAALRRAMGASGRSLFESRYTLGGQVAEFAELLRGVAQTRPAP